MTDVELTTDKIRKLQLAVNAEDWLNALIECRRVYNAILQITLKKGE